MAKKLLILFAVLGFALASCGGDGSGPDDGGASAAGPIEVEPGDAANGEAIFGRNCIACHGAAGVGISGLGKPMPGNTFIASLSDTELIAFIKAGRSPDHPDNTTGANMPPKGGDSSLTDQDLADVVAYIRTL